MDRRIRLVLSAQFFWVFIAAFVAYRVWGASQHAITSTTFGALIALANTGLIAWRLGPQEKSGNTEAPGTSPPEAVREADAAATREAHRHLKRFYRSALERYLVVGALFAVGLGGLKLMPVGLLGGFILGQVIWMAAPLIIKET